MPLKTPPPDRGANYKRPRKKEMWRKARETPDTKGPNFKDPGIKDEKADLNSIGNGISRISEKEDKMTPERQRDSDIDFLFRQFNVRNSFSMDDSKVKKWKKDSVLGKRGSEHQEEEVSLITDLRGLKKHQEEEEIRGRLIGENGQGNRGLNRQGNRERNRQGNKQQNKQQNKQNRQNNGSLGENIKGGMERNKRKYISDFFGDGKRRGFKR